MSEASTREQAGAVLNELTRQERDGSLEPGIPSVPDSLFIRCKGAGNRNIIEALRRRITATPESEFQEALEQVYRIAWFRLEKFCRR